VTRSCQEAASICRRACDVLHGWVDALQIPAAMIQEWRLAVEQLESAANGSACLQ
jgi:hypothetical protein